MDRPPKTGIWAGGRARRPLLLLAALAVLGLLCLLSIAVGARQIPLDQVLHALVDPHDRDTEAIVWDVRIPRTVVGLIAGASLGLAGAVMQALTRNPLADPGLMGISAGAAFAMVLAVGVAGITPLYGYVWFTFAGAAAAGFVVYFLGGLGRGGMTPVKLALAGIAITFLLESLTRGIVLVDPSALNRYRFWAAGSLSGQHGPILYQVLPFAIAGTLLSLSISPALNSLALGDDVAASLGRRLGLVRAQGGLAVVLLTGAAVSIAGPLVFIGLVVPHAARGLSGPDHRWLLPLSMAMAPSLLLAADIIGRLVARPQEVDAGIIAAFLGGPFFIALVRRRRLAEL